MAKWIKKGLIFCANKNYEWMQTHAALPIADLVSGDIYRIYFTTRDKQNRSHVAFVEVDIANPTSLRPLSSEPLLRPGLPGLFDDSGAMGSSLTRFAGRTYLYYVGWSLGISVPFYLNIGLAKRDSASEAFEKTSDAPLLERSGIDPYFTASASVMREKGIWKMWYTSGVKWKIEGGKAKHYYCLIKYAESPDGVRWNRDGIVCIDFKTESEYAISRPSVLKENGIYKMWYSYRGDSYRIGYAESYDGISWERKDNQARIDVSSSGWDSEMIEYPFVFVHNGIKHLLYNGNGFGKSGFGYAMWG